MNSENGLNGSWVQEGQVKRSFYEVIEFSADIFSIFEFRERPRGHGWWIRYPRENQEIVIINGVEFIRCLMTSGTFSVSADFDQSEEYVEFVIESDLVKWGSGHVEVRRFTCTEGALELLGSDGDGGLRIQGRFIRDWYSNFAVRSQTQTAIES